MFDMLKCEQNCGNDALAYAGDSSANGWAGYYCPECVVSLGFSVFSRYPNGIIHNGFLRKEGK